MKIHATYSLSILVLFLNLDCGQSSQQKSPSSPLINNISAPKPGKNFKILGPNDPIQFDPTITNIFTEKSDKVPPDSFYIYIGFGEKSGFNKGISFYHVSKVFSTKQIELKFDSTKKCYYIGPYLDPSKVVEMEEVANKIAEEKGWLHFITQSNVNR